MRESAWAEADWSPQGDKATPHTVVFQPASYEMVRDQFRCDPACRRARWRLYM